MTNVLKKRTGHDRVKTQTVFFIAEQFKVSSAYVYGTLRGDCVGTVPDEIKKAFYKKYNELKKVLAS